MLPFVLGLKFEIQPAILDALTTSFANPIFQLYALSTDEAKRVKEMFMLYKTTAPQSLHEAGSASCCLSWFHCWKREDPEPCFIINRIWNYVNTEKPWFYL